MLAEEITQPFTGAQLRHDGLDLIRPPTRLLIVADPENKFATPAACAAERRKVIDQADKTLRAHQLAVDRGDLELLVEIRTWGSYPFEFAHFTDDELANAALTHAKAGVQLTSQQLAPAFGRIRATSRNIDEIGASLRTPFDKLQLADTLWPVLEAKIKACAASGNYDSVPRYR